jgi:hypothetical protein
VSAFSRGDGVREPDSRLQVMMEPVNGISVNRLNVCDIFKAIEVCKWWMHLMTVDVFKTHSSKSLAQNNHCQKPWAHIRSLALLRHCFDSKIGISTR